MLIGFGSLRKFDMWTLTSIKHTKRKGKVDSHIHKSKIGITKNTCTWWLEMNDEEHAL